MQVVLNIICEVRLKSVDRFRNGKLLVGWDITPRWEIRHVIPSELSSPELRIWAWSIASSDYCFKFMTCISLKTRQKVYISFNPDNGLVLWLMKFNSLLQQKYKYNKLYNVKSRLEYFILSIYMKYIYYQYSCS